MSGPPFGEFRVVDDLASAFAEAVLEAYVARSDDLFSLALTGGGWARACYERLSEASEGRVDWLSVDIYWSDERCTPSDDIGSNQLLGRQALLEKVGGAKSVYPMSCEDGPDAYQLRIGQAERLDVVHLDVGADGHIAALFPASAAIDADPGQLVALNEDPTGSPGDERMTLTFAGIARARHVVVTVGGADKRDVVRRLLDGDDVPAARVRADRVIWLVDRAAAPDGLE